MLETLQLRLYQLQQFADALVSAQLAELNALSVAAIFSAGLLTSLTPCMLSMLPVTVGYIGGYEASGRRQALVQSAWFALGLASTLAALGILAATVGRVYGQIGVGLPVLVSLVAILMGLNLLELVPLRLPSLGANVPIGQDWPHGVRAYALGLTFGLVASPCSTPVLATLLAWVASTQDWVLGGALLFAYTAGYVLPLVVAGTFTATLKRLLALRRWSGWIAPASGALLVGFGAFSLLARVPVGAL
ncbi:MAG: cytochrome C biogenesis protein [Cyanobacteria bacterium QS_8_64_29]|nr:MAG: cytochrome C biogenesis protein [Cyanobacteria bacterium QS_8_64_29]